MNIHGLKSNINKFTGVNCKNPKFGVQIAIFCPNLLYKDLLAKNLGPFRTRSLAAPVEAETLDPVPIPSSTSAACLRLLRRAKAPFDPPSIDPRDPIPLGNEFLLFFFLFPRRFLVLWWNRRVLLLTLVDLVVVVRSTASRSDCLGFYFVRCVYLGFILSWLVFAMWRSYALLHYCRFLLSSPCFILLSTESAS